MKITDIKDIRKSVAYNQGKFAKELGVTIQSIVNWERGYNKPNYIAMDAIMKFCENHNIKLED